MAQTSYDTNPGPINSNTYYLARSADIGANCKLQLFFAVRGTPANAHQAIIAVHDADEGANAYAIRYATKTEASDEFIPMAENYREENL